MAARVHRRRRQTAEPGAAHLMGVAVQRSEVAGTMVPGGARTAAPVGRRSRMAAVLARGESSLVGRAAPPRRRGWKPWGRTATRPAFWRALGIGSPCRSYVMRAVRGLRTGRVAAHKFVIPVQWPLGAVRSNCPSAWEGVRGIRFVVGGTSTHVGWITLIPNSCRSAGRDVLMGNASQSTLLARTWATRFMIAPIVVRPRTTGAMSMNRPNVNSPKSTEMGLFGSPQRRLFARGLPIAPNSRCSS